jgi:hypothetical protein
MQVDSAGGTTRVYTRRKSLIDFILEHRPYPRAHDDLGTRCRGVAAFGVRCAGFERGNQSFVALSIVDEELLGPLHDDTSLKSRAMSGSARQVVTVDCAEFDFLQGVRSPRHQLYEKSRKRAA